jgi:hypothetical protein
MGVQPYSTCQLHCFQGDLWGDYTAVGTSEPRGVYCPPESAAAQAAGMVDPA